MKFTDNEITKAIECCLDSENNVFTCNDCAFQKYKMGHDLGCLDYMMRSVFDMIKRKNTKIETLYQENEFLAEDVSRLEIKCEWLERENESQKAEIEKLKIGAGLRNNRKYYRKFVDEVFQKEKGNDLLYPDFDYIYQLYFEQKEEIELLKETNKRLNGSVDLLKALDVATAKAEAIKEFAERLKKEKTRGMWRDGVHYTWVHEYDIDNLVKEMTDGVWKPIFTDEKKWKEMMGDV